MKPINNDNIFLYDRLSIISIFGGICIVIISFIKSLKYKKKHLHNYNVNQKIFRRGIIMRYMCVYIGFILTIIGLFSKLYINHLLLGTPLFTPLDENIINKFKDVMS